LTKVNYFPGSAGLPLYLVSPIDIQENFSPLYRGCLNELQPLFYPLLWFIPAYIKMKKISKYLSYQFLLSIIVTIAAAQDHSMHMSHSMSPAAKNVYLSMMDTMMINMDQAPKGKTAEQEFLLQMLPHHLGAVAMARYEIVHGKNFEMMQLAKSILAEQQSELATMKIWLSQPQNGGSAVNEVFSKKMDQSMSVMMQNMPALANLKDTDHAFAAVMLPHHRAAIDMAKAVLTQGQQEQVLGFAKMLISNEQIEIQQMSTFIQ
jgi:uncharacterized protein (DUF305 family)